MGKKAVKIGQPMAEVIKKKLQKLGYGVTGRIATTLDKIASGELEAIGNLPKDMQALYFGAVADAIEEQYGKVEAVGMFRKGDYNSGITAIPQPGFFTRNPEQVSKDLCGSKIIYEGKKPLVALVTATAAYHHNSQKTKTAGEKPGTIGAWPTQAGPVLIFSAHGQGKEGIVGIWGAILQDGTDLKMTSIGKTFDAYDRKGEAVGDRILLAPRDTLTDKVQDQYVRKVTGKEARGSPGAYSLGR